MPPLLLLGPLYPRTIVQFHHFGSTLDQKLIHERICGVLEIQLLLSLYQHHASYCTHVTSMAFHIMSLVWGQRRRGPEYLQNTDDHSRPLLEMTSYHMI